MYTGMRDFCPRIVVDQSTVVTSRMIRGRNHILGGVGRVQWAELRCEMRDGADRWYAAWFSRFVISSSAADE